jgi:quercetin dioxygenase-like cupin family protein
MIVLCALLLGCALGTAYSQATPSGTGKSRPGPGAPQAPDPTASDGDKYHVILENARVRVLRYHDEPGQKTHLHHHPHDFIMYALAPFSRTLTFADGKKQQRTFNAGEIAWVPAQTHVGENIGTLPTDGLIIEVKGCGSEASKGSPAR